MRLNLNNRLCGPAGQATWLVYSAPVRDASSKRRQEKVNVIQVVQSKRDANVSERPSVHLLPTQRSTSNTVCSSMSENSPSLLCFSHSGLPALFLVPKRESINRYPEFKYQNQESIIITCQYINDEKNNSLQPWLDLQFTKQRALWHLLILKSLHFGASLPE